MSNPSPDLQKAVCDTAVDGCLTCEAAHQLATTLSVPPLSIGQAADDAEVRIVRCQNGLFGYTKDKRPLQPADDVPDALRLAIDAALTDGRLPCAASWALADKFGLSKLEVAAACECLSIKISQCQLGAF